MDKGWSVGGGEGKLGSPREGRGGEFCESQTGCIFPMAPGEGCVTRERDGGGQGRGRFSCELQRKQQKGPRQEGGRAGGEDALSCHLDAPTWPWAT